jgi:hypothetical protein
LGRSVNDLESCAALDFRLSQNTTWNG